MTVVEYLNLRVGKDQFEAHIKRICKSNLKEPAKICTKCPFLEYVLKVMDDNKWAYSRRVKRSTPLKSYALSCSMVGASEAYDDANLSVADAPEPP